MRTPTIAYIIFMGKPLDKWPHGGARRRWEANTTMNLCGRLSTTAATEKRRKQTEIF
jgi:hypothetical protein